MDALTEFIANNLALGLLIGGALAALVISLLTMTSYRRVVSTNDVHIVQSGKKTISYGKDQPSGNVYYVWPAWIPVIGVKTINFPVSVFDVALHGYAAYDKGRVPFVIDVMAFFRITETNTAAQRIHSFEELITQLQAILQGACRAILATSEIEEILEGRGKFGDMFTKEVDHNLEAWGVQTVKCIELMDIRDADESNVIHNIMAKKKSLIEMHSRVEVAENNRAAKEKEIIAQRDVDLQAQDALEQVGRRTAEKNQAIGIADQIADQEVKVQAAITAQRDMDVKKVVDVRSAEIARDVQVVAADQARQVQVIAANGAKSQTVTVAEGDLERAKLHAEGIRIEGEAKGAADQAVLMAPVNAQLALAKEIGSSEGYQTYLVKIRTVEKDQAVGLAQAAALEKAEVKIIANAGAPVAGVESVMGLFTSAGGTQLGGALEALAQTDAGKALLAKVSR